MDATFLAIFLVVRQISTKIVIVSFTYFLCIEAKAFRAIIINFTQKFMAACETSHFCFFAPLQFILCIIILFIKFIIIPTDTQIPEFEYYTWAVSIA